MVTCWEALPAVICRWSRPQASRWSGCLDSFVPADRREGCSVRAAWYEHQGPAAEVLQTGEMASPQPGPGEVRVQLRLSGVNPGDTKKRSGWLGSSMPFPRVVPHSDGAGVVESVGDGVDP